MGTANNEGGGFGLKALNRLKTVEPPQWLSPSPQLSQSARIASQYLFSSLNPFCPKSPFDRLLVESFDAEQIWQQIDLQTQTLLSNLRRDLKRFERNPEEISKLFVVGGVKKKNKSEGFAKENENRVVVEEEEEFGDSEEDIDDEENGGLDDDSDDEDEDEDEETSGGGEGGIEDRFLKIKELGEYLEEDEAREYGGGTKDKDENDDDEDDVEDEIDGFGDEDDDDELGAARYEDFFGSKKKKSSKRESKPRDRSENFDTDDEQEDDKGFDNQNETLSTYEKQLAKQRSKIEEMEKSNLDPKIWTMQGEVSATKRPKNSALEVDLDFEHNVRPAPVITEEVTASLEEIIKKRISEGHFDDVQKAPSLPSKPPREVKEMDENKSKKGLAEIYEEDYAKTTGLASAPLSFSDEQKKEASALFQKLCLKLDALSHFHFTPKPIIEDMTIQTNVPALTMEEVAPVAVSDAAMLAPEEVFAGKGDIKEEAELTQEERKRRRANKKRKFKERSNLVEEIQNHRNKDETLEKKITIDISRQIAAILILLEPEAIREELCCEVQKEKLRELVQPHLKTDDSCVTALGAHPMRTSAGVVVCSSLQNANIA